jgi:hypothetical protein
MVAYLASVFDAASDGLKRGLQTAPFTVAIYILPALAGCAGLVLLEVTHAEVFGAGWAPIVLRSIVWAPFAAMIYVAWLHFVLHGEKPEPIYAPVLGRTTVLVALVYATWWAARDGIDRLIDGVNADVALLYNFDYDAAYLAIRAVWAVGFLIKTLGDTLGFGLLFVVVATGRLDFTAILDLIRRRPFTLYLIGFIAAAADEGIQLISRLTTSYLGLTIPYPLSMSPWRENVPMAFLAEIQEIPVGIPSFIAYAGIMTHAYQQLSSGGRPMQVPAG